ncbi:DUF1133 family protein [Xenorhabdus bovienii]|uniref:DUF1133 family protein n=1 Tax=Xenorhabdus bovienii TaxID=40576 RepID=UPI0023B2D0EF|nr:DUF1133 family protein [Xenorhabdus bovienii]MDE9429087.1 DUF1133 family protein [Xenorhabdus bovienii]MDE9437387.1 DUF1133 family protein [Xenorhabdus bovienii]MDE9455331.1 DUF1133 family protein [Xenorhabdus bovienii]MDE9499264.1 DUF1133 family protein [Xenorhabdus bovienii]MDE9538855.1 DUF1133 family protein [Xenorhabdus bovienii]
MIYPNTCGKGEEYLRLRTLESVWIRGRLSMWGCWAVIRKSPQAAGVFSRLLASPVITKKSLQVALKKMQQAGIAQQDLLLFFEEMKEKQAISSLMFCTDTEGLKMNNVIGQVFKNDRGLLNIIKERYCYKKSKYKIAVEMNERHPEMSLRTCQRRVNAWLDVAEFMLYRPMSDEFERRYHYTR